MSVSVALRPLTPADLPAYRELYESAFPAGERKELSFMTEGPCADAYDLLVIGTPEVSVAGLIITVRYGDLLMLDYLAVQPALRSQGIGHAALPRILDFCRDRAPGARIFLEIEEPTDDCDNPVQRTRRKAFYLSCGFAETSVRAHIYGTDMELLAPPADVPYITHAGYAALLRETFPADMVPAWEPEDRA